MSDDSPDRQSFVEWILQPETLIALSAVLLSLCGLFISIYEASLFREEQRASVWPHTEVTGTINEQTVTLRVQNTGIGPARVRAATVTYEGKTLPDWRAMIHRVAGDELADLGFNFSLITGRVLPIDSPPENIFSITSDRGPGSGELVTRLRHAIVDDGTVDVTVCYCSVYDECWTSNLQDVISRRQANAVPTGAREVKSCDAMERSGI